jgi:hypothetical protein
MEQNTRNHQYMKLKNLNNDKYNEQLSNILTMLLVNKTHKDIIHLEYL